MNVKRLHLNKIYPRHRQRLKNVCFRCILSNFHFISFFLSKVCYGLMYQTLQLNVFVKSYSQKALDLIKNNETNAWFSYQKFTNLISREGNKVTFIIQVKITLIFHCVHSSTLFKLILTSHSYLLLSDPQRVLSVLSEAFLLCLIT